MNCKECKNKKVKEMIQKDHYDCVKNYLTFCCAKSAISEGNLISSDQKIDGELLIEAAKYNNVKMLEMLIENVNLNYTDKYGNTALMMAAMKNNTNCCKLLIDTGANVNLKNVYGSDAKSLARSSECKDVFEEKKVENKAEEKVVEKIEEKIGKSCIIL